MYIISTLCIGNKYEPIFNHWVNRIKQRCNNNNFKIELLNNTQILNNYNFDYNKSSVIWAIRWKNLLELMNKEKTTIVMCDIDVIIEKDIQPIINLPFDIIFSKEINGDKAYPQHCTSRIGFGICAGFCIYKNSSIKFINKIFEIMKSNKNTYDDQVIIMEYILENYKNIYDEEITLDNNKYTNKIIEIDDIKICVLDFDIVIRDPIYNNGQYADHINIDNVGGTDNYIKYFYNDLNELPLTCRCGKTWLGDYNICPHINIKEKFNLNK